MFGTAGRDVLMPASEQLRKSYSIPAFWVFHTGHGDESKQGERGRSALSLPARGPFSCSYTEVLEACQKVLRFFREIYLCAISGRGTSWLQLRPIESLRFAICVS
jgi:hypothetical protein